MFIYSPSLCCSSHGRLCVHHEFFSSTKASSAGMYRERERLKSSGGFHGVGLLTLVLFIKKSISLVNFPIEIDPFFIERVALLRLFFKVALIQPQEGFRLMLNISERPEKLIDVFAMGITYMYRIQYSGIHKAQRVPVRCLCVARALNTPLLHSSCIYERMTRARLSLQVM